MLTKVALSVLVLYQDWARGFHCTILLEGEHLKLEKCCKGTKLFKELLLIIKKVMLVAQIKTNMNWSQQTNRAPFLNDEKLLLLH